MTRGQSAAVITFLLGESLLLIWGWASAGWQMLAACAIALALSSFSLLTLTLMTRSFLRVSPEAVRASRVTTVAILLKLPAIVVGVYIGTRFSGAPLYGFLLTIGLVYFCFVWFLAARGDF